MFEGVPELILGPEELEFSPKIKRSNQIYLGLSIKTDRADCEIDLKSIELESLIQNQKFQGKKIVYCSFGTFYRDSMKLILNFIERLMIATKEMENVFFVLSVNKLVIETLRAKYEIKSNMVFYSKVDQLLVLKNADVHITHGGFGSIKESIFFEVPMLVYPLDLRFDQNGNGLKVTYHKIGLNGTLATDSSAEIRYKILELLENTKYKTTVKLLSENVKKTYTDSSITKMLTQLININLNEN